MSLESNFAVKNSKKIIDIDYTFLSPFASYVYGKNPLCYQTEGSAGIDLRAVEFSLPNDETKYVLNNEDDAIKNIDKHDEYQVVDKCCIQPSGRVLVKTGLGFSIPINHEMQVRPRSGLAWKHGITIVNTPGTVDSDYRGEIAIILLNTCKDPFYIKSGDRIAQAVFNLITHAELRFVGSLDKTIRGSSGLGSTGL